MKNILYLGATSARPKTDRAYIRKFEVFSQNFNGYIITSVMGQNELGVSAIGGFRLISFLDGKGNGLLRNIITFYLLISNSLKLYFTQKIKIDAVITHSPLLIGVATILIAKLIKAKSIIEINGCFEEAFKYERPGIVKRSLGDRIKEQLGITLTKFCIIHCDRVKLLYDNQLESLKLPVKKIIPQSIFSEFVPISEFINNKKTDDKFILLLGFPWYLKGVDILIKAFKIISPHFPEYSLKIHGWNPTDNDFFQELVGGHERIHLGKALNYSSVVKAMNSCSLYVLASRTEAMGRVLVEAMASKKPIISSNVGGTSSIIIDGYNGLLFEKENVDELAGKITRILSDKKLSEALAENGYKYVQEKFSESNYLQKYKSMIELL
jgi:glycosyltransferase involved in cell wall biosynthesis